MKGKELYPNIAYFKLAKELPSAKVGSEVVICDADGRQCLHINEISENGVAFGEGISFDIGFAKRYPDWFIPVTEEDF